MSNRCHRFVIERQQNFWPSTFYILHLTFPFIFNIRAVSMKLFVCIVGVLATADNTFSDQSTKVVSGTQACSPPFKRCLRPTDGAKRCEIDNKWKSLWISLPKTSKACIELLKCGCKEGCSGMRQSQSTLYKRFFSKTLKIPAVSQSAKLIFIMSPVLSLPSVNKSERRSIICLLHIESIKFACNTNTFH